MIVMLKCLYFLDRTHYYNFIMPEFGLVEIDKYRNLIFKKSKMQSNELITYSYSEF